VPMRTGEMLQGLRALGPPLRTTHFPPLVLITYAAEQAGQGSTTHTPHDLARLTDVGCVPL